MVGIQGSGKSFVVEKLENSEGYLVASNDRNILPFKLHHFPKFNEPSDVCHTMSSKIS